MAKLLKSGELGEISIKHMKKLREQTVKKWDSLGFLDGLSGHTKENITDLYECEASSLINEIPVHYEPSEEPMPIIKKVLDEIGDNDIVAIAGSASTSNYQIMTGSTSHYSGAYISGGYNCTIEPSKYSSIIGGGSSNYNNYSNAIGSAYSNNTVNTDIPSADDYFIEESKKYPEELILKYSPSDSKWKVFNRGTYVKVNNIIFNNCNAKSQTFNVNGKVIGCFVVGALRTQINGGDYIIG